MSQTDFLGQRAHRLRADRFPLTIILLSLDGRRELYRVTCERPTGDALQSVYVPGRETLGEPVLTRIEYGDGTVEESRG